MEWVLCAALIAQAALRLLRGSAATMLDRIGSRHRTGPIKTREFHARRLMSDIASGERLRVARGRPGFADGLRLRPALSVKVQKNL